ncbi:hypothetical protein OG618_37325 (plasmid) [Kitasatospora sp. NBC_01246]|uniref:hypothetical protein n=1 Tax=Kitasatospora sp. NBC_01246 TaxID=2903570 RepID=UPI002E30DC60|nr:hypothetical protein [Kitasatospora sp. NBC_01246]
MSAVSRQGLGLCRRCLATVRRTITRAGVLQLVDTDPHEGGNVVAYCDGTGTWRSRVPTAELPQAPHERRFMPHAATCAATARPPAPAPEQARLPEGVASLDAHRRRHGRPKARPDL